MKKRNRHFMINPKIRSAHSSIWMTSMRPATGLCSFSAQSSLEITGWLAEVFILNKTCFSPKQLSANSYGPLSACKPHQVSVLYKYKAYWKKLTPGSLTLVPKSWNSKCWSLIVRKTHLCTVFHTKLCQLYFPATRINFYAKYFEHYSTVHSVGCKETLVWKLSTRTRAMSLPAHNREAKAVYLKSAWTVTLCMRPDYWLLPEPEEKTLMPTHPTERWWHLSPCRQATPQVTCFARSFCDEAISSPCRNPSGADCFPASSCRGCGRGRADPRGWRSDAGRRACARARGAGAHRSACSCPGSAAHPGASPPGTARCGGSGRCWRCCCRRCCSGRSRSCAGSCWNWAEGTTAASSPPSTRAGSWPAAAWLVGEEGVLLRGEASCKERCFVQQVLLARECCWDLALAEEWEGNMEAPGSSASSGGLETVASWGTGWWGSVWKAALEEDRAQSLAWEACSRWLEGWSRLSGGQFAAHTGTARRAAAGEAAAGSEGGRSVSKLLLLVPPGHGDILAQNGKTWLTFIEENKNPVSHNFCKMYSRHLQELLLKCWNCSFL